MSGQGAACFVLPEQRFKAAVETLAAQRQIGTDAGKTLTTQRHVALFLGKLLEIAPTFYDQLPTVMPSAVEVELLALTLFTYAAFDYLGIDQYSEELVKAFTTCLADYLAVLGANKSGAPWPALVPFDKTFPQLLP